MSLIEFEEKELTDFFIYSVVLKEGFEKARKEEFMHYKIIRSLTKTLVFPNKWLVFFLMLCSFLFWKNGKKFMINFMIKRKKERIKEYKRFLKIKRMEEIEEIIKEEEEQLRLLEKEGEKAYKGKLGLLPLIIIFLFSTSIYFLNNFGGLIEIALIGVEGILIFIYAIGILSLILLVYYYSVVKL